VQDSTIHDRLASNNDLNQLFIGRKGRSNQMPGNAALPHVAHFGSRILDFGLEERHRLAFSIQNPRLD
jgi:hypothetical protein